VFEEEMPLGTVVEVERILDNDYLKIKTDEALVEKKLPKTFLIPYLDNFVKEVDVENKTIHVSGAYDILEAS
jgi:16S rRNA processing protein RimM